MGAVVAALLQVGSDSLLGFACMQGLGLRRLGCFKFSSSRQEDGLR